ncbi:MAG: hypothetical protein JWL96_953 [Sphingomonas bacterium]|uniref:NUDIX domain-containing protein n=1 Tax=Sphingomonas bacterium TaxID=1895847 RepID=UPI00261A7B8D|nr:NUDIX domain-containing protein [Sphingomonas bacterium]MDB5708883.1 hypothetical protein [Sphingomonas bacterium]
MTTVYHGLQAARRMTGIDGKGVKAMVVTPTGQIVLVRHSYLPGWHFPGGGLKRRETPEQGIIRELGEEIGLHRWGKITRGEEERERTRPGQVYPTFFIVTDADYHFRPNLEIEQAEAFDPGALPDTALASVHRTVERWHSGKSHDI